MREQLIRIGLRYLAMYFAAKGWFSSEDGSAFASDPDVAMIVDIGIGVAIAWGTEAWFWWTAPSKEAVEVSKAVDAGQKVTVEGPRGGKTVIHKDDFTGGEV